MSKPTNLFATRTVAGATISIILLLCAIFLVISQGRSTHNMLAATALDVRTIIDGSIEPSSPIEEIVASLISAKPRTGGNTSDVVDRLWLVMDIPGCQNNQPCSVELRHFRSRLNKIWVHTQDNGVSKYNEVDSANVKSLNVGTVIELPLGSHPDRIIGFVTPQTNKPLTAFLWESSKLSDAEFAFERTGGILLGSLLFLSLFSGALALLYKDLPFLLLGGWLVAMLRLAAVNGGWDLIWFGLEFERETISVIMRLTMGAFGFLSAAIIGTLFYKTLSRAERVALNLTMVTYSMFIALAPFSNQNYFVKFFWAFSGVALILTLAISAKQLIKFRSSISIWFFLAWSTIALGSVCDALFSMGMLDNRLNFINLQTSAIAAGFVMAIALANRMQSEKLERISAEKSANLALIKYQDNYDKVPVGLFTLLPTGEIPQHNPAFAVMFGVQPNTAPTWDALIPDYPLTSLNPNTDTHAEFSTKTADQTRWFEVQTLRQNNVIEGTIAEITERKLGEQQLQYAAHFDQLTALQNRHYMIQRLDQMLAFTDGPNTHIGALVMFDIERFHQVVTYFGHSTGDDVLCAVRDRIRDKTPDGTLLGRLSADTFILIFDGATLSVARQITQRILDTIHSSPFATSDKSFNLRVRAGVIELDTSMSSKDALSACDAAMEDAKLRGGGCLVAYADQDPAWLNHKAESDLMAQFAVHIPFERMEMFYQPIISLNNPDKSMGYEALIRLHGEDGRLVSPAHFIPALEKSGMMSQLDRWVVRDVFAFLERYPKHFEQLTYCSINLSGASLNDERFLDEMLSLAAQHPHTVQKICFEITETVALADVQSTKRFVQNIKALGARIALDDFGAGYSSFGYLSELNADFIKIDGNLVNGLMQSSTNFAVVKAIADLGRSLNMYVVAEWVENADVLQILLNLGVSAGQGWALGKPMRADDIAQHSDGGTFIKDEEIRKVLKLDTKAGSVKVKPTISAPIAV